MSVWWFGGLAIITVGSVLLTEPLGWFAVIFGAVMGFLYGYLVPGGPWA